LIISEFQVYKDYNNLVESMKHQAHDKRGSRGGGGHHDGKDESKESVDAETSFKLRRALEEVEVERQNVAEKLRRCEADLETIPLLRAQVSNKEITEIINFVVI
jgi:hypothetical protein